MSWHSFSADTWFSSLTWQIVRQGSSPLIISTRWQGHWKESKRNSKCYSLFNKHLDWKPSDWKLSRVITIIHFKRYEVCFVWKLQLITFVAIKYRNMQAAAKNNLDWRVMKSWLRSHRSLDLLYQSEYYYNNVTLQKMKDEACQARSVALYNKVVVTMETASIAHCLNNPVVMLRSICNTWIPQVRSSLLENCHRFERGVSAILTKL